MRVLHVIDALGLGGGAEHSLAVLLPRLRDRGVDSSVACLTPREGGLQAEVAAMGFPVEVLEGGSRATQVRALRRKVRREEPDLVHATLVNACLVSRLANVRSPVPLLNSVVNTSYDPVRADHMGIAPWKLRAMRAVDGLTARHLVDHLHALTVAVAEELEDVLGVDPDRVTVIPRGRSEVAVGTADATRRARAREALGLDADVPVVVNVGRQDLQKAQADLVRAFAHVRDRHPGAVLLVAGRQGAATAEIEAAVADHGLEGSVRLLGHRTDVLEVVAAADVFAFPSHYEGLGCSLIEAMALGVPVVGSDAAAIAEVLDGGSAGRVVRRGDEEALAEALADLLADPGERSRLVQQGRARFRERYELERVVEATLALYRRLVGEGGSSTPGARIS